MNSPIVSWPAITSRPPKRRTAAIPSEGRKRSPGRKCASTEPLASSRGALPRPPRKRVRTSSSRPKACTISMPTTASSVASARFPSSPARAGRSGEPVCEEPGQDRDRRHRERGVEREPGVHGDEHDCRARDHHRALDPLDDAPADEVADGVDVVRGPRDHLARRVPVEEGAWIGEVGVVEHPAQARLDRDPERGREPAG